MRCLKGMVDETESAMAGGAEFSVAGVPAVAEEEVGPLRAKVMPRLVKKRGVLACEVEVDAVVKLAAVFGEVERMMSQSGSQSGLYCRFRVVQRRSFGVIVPQ